jgi:hypothetical protein
MASISVECHHSSEELLSEALVVYQLQSAFLFLSILVSFQHTLHPKCALDHDF